jgi:hypothetical protein
MKRVTGVKFCSKDATCSLNISIWLHSKLATDVNLAEGLRYFNIQMCLLQLSHRMQDANVSQRAVENRKGTQATQLWNDVRYTAK